MDALPHDEQVELMAHFEVACADRLASARDTGEQRELTLDDLRLCSLAPARLSDLTYLELLKRPRERDADEPPIMPANYTPPAERTEDQWNEIYALFRTAPLETNEAEELGQP